MNEDLDSGMNKERNMESWDTESATPAPQDEIVLASVALGQPSDLSFPLDFVRDKIFLTGITGSGKIVDGRFNHGRNQPCRSSIRLF